MDGLEKEFKSFSKTCLCAVSTVRDATFPEARKRKCVGMSKVAREVRRSLMKKRDLLPCKLSRVKLNLRLLLSRTISGHILVGEPKRVHDDIRKDVGLMGHHTVTDIVPAMNKKKEMSM